MLIDNILRRKKIIVQRRNCLLHDAVQLADDKWSKKKKNAALGLFEKPKKILGVKEES